MIAAAHKSECRVATGQDAKQNSLTTPIICDSASRGKRFATLQAFAALAGITLVQTDNDRGQPLFVASKWALTKSFDELDAVSAWLRHVTGKAVE